MKRHVNERHVNSQQQNQLATQTIQYGLQITYF